MIIVEGDVINNLYEAYLWLREAWEYEPYNMWYEEFGEKDSEYYRECIFIEPVRGYEGLNSWDICNLQEFKEFIKNFSDFDVKLFAYEEAGRNNIFNLKQKIKEGTGKRIVVLVGPEGGISENEVKLLESNGFISVGLGPRILRTETAPLYVMSAISYELEIGGSNE